MVLRQTTSYLRPYRWWFLLALIQVAGMSALELLKPWPLKLVIDNVLTGTVPGWWPFADSRTTTLLAAASVGLVALYVVLGALSVVNNYTTISIGQGMVNDLRGRLYAHLQRLSLSFHSRASVGDLIYRVTSDTYAIQTLTMNGLFPIVSALFLLVGMFVIMLRLDPILTLLALGVCPLLLVGVILVNHRLTALATEAREKESAVYELVQRNLAAIRVVQAFSREAEEHRRFVAGSRASLQSSLRLYTLQTAYGAGTNVIMAVGTALVLWFGAEHVWRGRLTAGDLIVFVSYLASLYGPINSIVQTYGMISSAKAGVVRVFDILGAEASLKDGTAALVEPVRGRIEFRQVRFTYGSERPALQQVNLVVEPGDCVAIVGPTGAGKSTLVGLVARFYDPTEGQVLLDGVDIRTLRLSALRQQVAMVLQPPIVFPLSIHDNIAYGRPSASRAEVEAAGRTAQADGFISRLPAGYDTIVGEQGATLSEGERQRLTIARALLRNAPLLILDEPTSSVDAATEAAIMDGLHRLIAGRTTFVIAHRLSTVRRATRIVFLDEGVVVESGTFTELMARQGAFHRMYMSQFEAADRGTARLARTG